MTGPAPEMDNDPRRGGPDRVDRDGRSALAITIVAVLLIAFLISRLV